MAGKVYLNYASPALVNLSTINGRKLTIDNVDVVLPTAGLPLTNAGLAPLTTYCVYATPDGLTPLLYADTVWHGQDDLSGMEVKNGDRSSTFVGMVRTDENGNFVESAERRWVCSWFNRRKYNLWKQAGGALAASNEFRPLVGQVSFLTAGYSYTAGASGWTGSDTVGADVDSVIHIDEPMGSRIIDGVIRQHIGVGMTNVPVGFSIPGRTNGGVDGLVTVSLYGRTSQGTCYWASNAPSPGNRTSIWAEVEA